MISGGCFLVMILKFLFEFLLGKFVTYSMTV